ncbi:hypothetical protein DICVIV_07094, partial [Dictyocaulus viviparus]
MSGRRESSLCNRSESLSGSRVSERSTSSGKVATVVSFASYGTPVPAQSIVSLVLWFLCLLYASIRTSSNSSLGKIREE